MLATTQSLPFVASVAILGFSCWSTAQVAIPPAFEEVPSLTAIRDVLATYQTAIIHTVLALSVLGNSTVYPYSVTALKTGVNRTLQSLVDVDHMASPSVASTVSNQQFVSRSSCGRELVPYINYARNASVGAEFGDQSASPQLSLFNYVFDELLATSNGASAGKNATAANSVSMLNPILPVVSTASSLLALLATRVGTGNAVALAKLYDAGTTPVNTSSMPNATICGYLQDNDTVSVRAALTVPAQVESVRESVAAQTRAWVNVTGAITAEVWVPKLVGLFDNLINTTTDVEVATLLQRQQLGLTGC